MSWRELPGGVKVECAAYAVIAVAAFVGTQWALLAGLHTGDMSTRVWANLTANPTVVFTTIDLFAVFLAAMVFMIVDGRRLRLRAWWLYPLLSVGIGVSFGFPLFLLARRLRTVGAGAAV